MNPREIIKIDLKEVRLRFIHDFQYLSEYIKFNKAKLLERQVNLNEMSFLDMKENPDSIDIIRQLYDDDYKRIPAYFNHSTIISIYSMLEYTLREICERIIQETKTPITLEDLTGGNYIQKSKDFLLKIALIKFEKIEKEWINITRVQKIRNVIVHENSRFFTTSSPASNDHKFLKLLGEFEGIEIDRDSGYFFIVDSKVLDNFIQTVEAFLLSIMQQVEEKEFKFFGIDYKAYYNAVYGEYHSIKPLEGDLFDIPPSELDDLPF